MFDLFIGAEYDFLRWDNMLKASYFPLIINHYDVFGEYAPMPITLLFQEIAGV